MNVTLRKFIDGRVCQNGKTERLMDVDLRMFKQLFNTVETTLKSVIFDDFCVKSVYVKCVCKICIKDFY